MWWSTAVTVLTITIGMAAAIEQAGSASAMFPGGGGCSPGVVFNNVTTSATNVTFTWTVSPWWIASAVNFGVSGSSNPLGFNQTAGSQTYAGVVTTSVIYLVPSTIYSFQVKSWCDGTTVATGVQQFTTQSYVPQTLTVNGPLNGGSTMQLANLSGFVTNATGATPPNGTSTISSVAVEVSCVGGGVGIGSPYPAENNSTNVLANGQFSLYVPYPCKNSYYPHATNAYLVTVVNAQESTLLQANGGCWYCQNPEFYPYTYSWGWPGFWNVTIRIPVPEFVPISMPANQIGPWTPEVLQFSNAPGPGYTSISYSQTVSYSNEFCAPFIYGSENGCSSWSWSATTTYKSGSAHGGGLEYLTQQMASGTAYFNSSNRTWGVLGMENYGNYLAQGFYYPGDSQYIPSPFSPSDTVPGQYILVNQQNGKSFQNIKIGAGSSVTYKITSGQGTIQSWNLGITLEADIPIGDVATLSLSTDLTFSQTTSVSQSAALSFTLSSPSGVTSCYNVYATGPSNNAQALVIGIYWWNYANSHSSSGACLTP